VTIDDLERDIRQTAAAWVFIRWISTEDKTDHSLKMRLHATRDCFIQVYANIQKQLWATHWRSIERASLAETVKVGNGIGIRTALPMTMISARTGRVRSHSRSFL